MSVEYTYEEAPDRIRKPMRSELQQILDDAQLAGFEIWGNLDDAIFIVKRREREVPKGLQIMPDLVAFRVDQPSLDTEISDYAVMRTVLGFPPRPATQSE
jgi:hypothetical protein